MPRAETAQASVARRRTALTTVCLLVLVLALYAQVRHHGFVRYDDDRYVTDNPHVKAGWTAAGVVWAFTATHASNWHPLTWLSHMLDVELFGLDPAGHHTTSVLLHASNAALLLLLLRRMTGSLWPSVFVAALFAIHPLRVESVAWVAERKDVLAGFFWMLTLLAYVRYSARPTLARYAPVALCLTLGLMAKPMLVSLPLVLLLLDAWPLGRLRSLPLRLHLLEKIPLLALCAASSVVTIAAQKAGGAMHAGETWSVGQRLANAAVSYVLYLWKTIWPAGLACFYPHPASFGSLPAARVLGAVLLLALASVLALHSARRRPWVTVGWFWYTGTLVPVIGIVQVGSQAMADRYAYLPLIGIYIAVVWSVAELLQRRSALRGPVLAVASVALLALCVVSWRQIGHWRDGRVLFGHALAVTHGNYVAHTNLGSVLEAEDDLEGAAAHFRSALAIRPDFPPPHNNLGLVRTRQGDLDRAVEHFERALALDPGYAEAHSNLGAALERRGDLAGAAAHFRSAIRLDPDHAEAHNNLGVLYERAGDLARAAEQYGSALRLMPGFAEAHSNLGNVLLSRGDLAAARGHYERALEARPDFAEAHNNLAFVSSRLGDARTAVTHYRRALELQPELYQAASGLAWILATHPDPSIRDGAEARQWAQRCVRATDRRDPACLEALAAALAELGEFDRALEWQGRALARVPADRSAPVRARLESYRAARPHRESR